MHTVSGPLGVRRVDIRTLLFWAPHVGVFLERRGLETSAGRIEEKFKRAKGTPGGYTYNSSWNLAVASSLIGRACLVVAPRAAFPQ